MKKLFKKIKNNYGETIGETLVALLVSSLALVMLAGAIATTSGIITRSSDRIKEYYSRNEAVINMNSGAYESGVKLTIAGEAGASDVKQDVLVSIGENSVLNNSNPVIVFRKPSPEPGN